MAWISSTLHAEMETPGPWYLPTINMAMLDRHPSHPSSGITVLRTDEHSSLELNSHHIMVVRVGLLSQLFYSCFLPHKLTGESMSDPQLLFQKQTEEDRHFIVVVTMITLNQVYLLLCSASYHTPFPSFTA